MKNYLKHIFTAITMIVVSTIIVSCGGGGGSSGSTSTGPSNTNPGSTPTVTMSQPLNNAESVSLRPSVVLVFSEAVTNVSTSTVKVYESSIADGNVVPTSNPTLGAGNTYTFNFPSNLNQNTKYYVVVGSGIKSASSGQEVETTNFNFTTGTFASPTVSLINPANESTNVPVSTLIQLQFSESVANVTTATVTVYSGSANGTPVSVTSITPGAGNSYTLNLAGNLDYSTDYYVELSNGITSADEGVPLQATTFHFKTSAQPAAPTVLMISPTNGSTTESLDPTIKIQFSESVTGVNPTTIQLREGSESGALLNTVIISDSNNVYSLTPYKTLDGNSPYYVVINPGIKSVSTGTDVASTSFNFNITGPFAYIANESGVSVCKIVDSSESGGLEDCKVTVSSKHAYRVRINPSHKQAYIVSQHDNSVTVCTINSLDGTLSNCITINTNNYFTGATDIAFTNDNRFAYVAVNTVIGAITFCSVVESSGLLTSCDQSSINVLGMLNITSVAVDPMNKFLYISNINNHGIAKCPLSQSTGKGVGGCVADITNISSINALTTNNNIYAAASTNVQGCSIDEQGGGSLTCSSAASSTYSNLYALDFNAPFNVLYLADNGNGSITACHQNESGMYNNCSKALSNQGSLTGLAILSN